MAPEILFLMARHGSTAGNAAQIYRGWSNDDFAQLSAKGRDDVRDAGIFLKTLNIQFPLIISDDLDRAQETRKILASILGIKAEYVDKRLRPLNVGDFTGQGKEEHPLDEYMKNRSRTIPGGESLNNFDNRLGKVFDNILETINKIKKPILIVGHGSTASFLANSTKPTPVIPYEGITDPGGVTVFTKDGLTPIFKKRNNAKGPYDVGTSISGFVSDEESPLPRACWQCRWFVRDVNKQGGCLHPLVRITPELQDRKQVDGTIAVGDDDCCSFEEPHISLSRK